MSEPKEIWSVSQIRDTLREIDACENTAYYEYTDGTKDPTPCTMQHMCDDCVMKMACMLSWAVDFERDGHSVVSSAVQN